MSDQKPGPDTEKMINLKDSTNVPLVHKEDQEIPAHNTILTTCSPTHEERIGFPCDKCDKYFPNDKSAKDLHMQRTHNIKTLQSTPGPRNAAIDEEKANKEMKREIDPVKIAKELKKR